MTRLRALLLPALPALILLAPPARGQDCNARVLDMASVVTDAARVEAALEALRPLGIDAHAVTLPDLGGARDLDEAIGRLGASCPSWRSGDARRPDILVIGVALAERQSGLYYGDALTARLGPAADRLRMSVMSPHLREGRFDEAFMAVAEETARVMAQARVATPGAAPAAPSPAAPSRSTGLGILGVLVLVVGGAVGGAALWRRWRRERAEREALDAARRRSEAARASCTNEIAALIADCASMTERARLLEGKVAEDELEPLSAALAGAQRSIDEATVAQGRLVEGGPARTAATQAEHDAVTAEFERLLAGLSPARRAVEAARGTLGEITQALSELGPALDEARRAIAAAPATLKERLQPGAAPASLERALAGAAEVLKEAEGLAARRRPVAALAAVRRATAVVESALAVASRWDEVRAETEASLPALQARAARVEREIAAARAAFDAMAAAYAEACWTNVRGNVTEATNRLEAARVDLQEAEQLARDGDWAGASDEAGDAEGHLDEAESLVRSILARRDHLERTRTDAPRELDAAADDVARAEAFLRDTPGPHGAEVVEGLEAARRQLAAARAGMEAPRPDVVGVVAGALAANAAADAVLARAVAEHDERERQRRLADSALRDAERKVSKAREYLEDHARDVPLNDLARAQLAEAGDALEQARATDDAARQAELAGRAHDQAAAAYERASRLVERAESARRPAGPAWGTPWVITTGGSRPRSGGGWSGGGGGGGRRSSGGWGGGGRSSGGWGGGRGGKSSGGW